MDHKDKDDSSSNIIERREQNAKLEAIVWRKLDMFVVPIVTMYYLLSFLVGSRFLFREYALILFRTASILETRGSLASKRISKLRTISTVSP